MRFARIALRVLDVIVTACWEAGRGFEARRWTAGAVLAILFVALPVTLSADHKTVPYSAWVTASAYGPCCYAGSEGAGSITYDGRNWHGLDPWESSIASPYLPRGTGICIAVPSLNVLRCDRPADADGLTRSRLTISDHLPAYHNRGLDLSVGFLRDIDFCEGGQTDMACARSWGVRTVRLFVFG
jgi:hypothetical protein